MRQSIIVKFFSLLVLITTACGYTEYDVTYRVTGACEDVSVTYTKCLHVDESTYSLSYVTLPWEESFTYSVCSDCSSYEFEAILTAQKNTDDNSVVRVEILVDGDLAKESCTFEPYGFVKIKKTLDYGK